MHDPHRRRACRRHPTRRAGTRASRRLRHSMDLGTSCPGGHAPLGRGREAAEALPLRHLVYRRGPCGPWEPSLGLALHRGTGDGHGRFCQTVTHALGDGEAGGAVLGGGTGERLRWRDFPRPTRLGAAARFSPEPGAVPRFSLCIRGQCRQPPHCRRGRPLQMFAPGGRGTARPPGPAGHSGHPLLATLAWATSEADHTRGGGLSGP